MKILHCCLSNFYIDGYNYQENVLPRINADDGNDVRIIASTEVFIHNTSIGYIAPSTYATEYGVPIIRLPYVNFFNHFVSSKIRAYSGLYKELQAFSPDVILFHGLCAQAMTVVVKYKRNYPKVRLYADSHEDFNNSARNFLSRYILHRFFYRIIIEKAYPYIDKIFYVWLEAKDFINKLYGLPDDKLEFYPLGGIIPEEELRSCYRRKVRKDLKIAPESVLFLHSGKLERLKRTEELIHAFSAVDNPIFQLVIIGSIPADMEPILLPLIEADPRIRFLGWKNAEELQEYLCACDVYLQPGSQSATLQNAVCCGAPIMLYPHKSYLPLMKGNGWFVESESDMKRVFEEVSSNLDILKSLSRQSLSIALEIFDYKKLAARIYE